MVRIFLAGGGSSQDSLLLDKAFAREIQTGKPLLYVPQARKAEEYQTCLGWVTSLFLPLGITQIKMLRKLKEFLTEKVNPGGIYLGGGDTAKLLKDVRASGFDKYLVKAIQKGIPVYGGSAGAIILGQTILVSPEVKGLNTDEAKGLNILNGFSIYCHYDGKENLGELCKRLGTKIIAIPEKSGVYIHNGSLSVVGYKPIVAFSAHKNVILQPGDTINLESIME